MSLKVLVLHNLESLHGARRSALDHLTAFRRNAPEHEFHFRSVSWPVTDNLKSQPWDAVIFTSTALGIVTYRPRELFAERRQAWQFLAHHPACKIVFPQDDADHGALLDEWFAEMNVDYVFTVRPECKEFIYPRTSKRAAFEQTYAGYLDADTMAEAAAFRKPFAERTVAIGQRVTLYPAHGGRLGRLKGEAALAVKAAANARHVKEDISVDPDNVFTGLDWYRFLGNCQFTVGAEGGLGVWDATGEIVDKVRAYVAANPSAHFDEIEAACFPGRDGDPEFPGFSPRLLESALMGCCQILVEGEYRGRLKPWEHYIPLARDFSNMAEVFVAMRDEELVARLIAACDADLVASSTFRYATLVARVMEVVKAHPHAASRVSTVSLEPPMLSLMVRERGFGFSGSALAERVGQFVGAQTEPSPNGALVAEIETRVTATAALAVEYLETTESPDGMVVAALRQGADAAAALGALAAGAAEGPRSSEACLLAVRAVGAIWSYSSALFDFATGRPPDAMAQILASTAGKPVTVDDLRQRAATIAQMHAGGAQADYIVALGQGVPADFLKILSMLVQPAGVRGSWYADDLARLDASRSAVATVVGGGDAARLQRALAAAGPAVAGIVSRLLPAGEHYTAEELAWLEQVDRILIRSERDPERLTALENFQQRPPR